MATRKQQRKIRVSRRDSETARVPLAVWLGLLVMLALFVILIGQSMVRNDALREAEQAIGSTAVTWPEWNPQWPPLPTPKSALPRPMHEVRRRGG